MRDVLCALCAIEVQRNRQDKDSNRETDGENVAHDNNEGKVKWPTYIEETVPRDSQVWAHIPRLWKP